MGGGQGGGDGGRQPGACLGTEDPGDGWKHRGAGVPRARRVWIAMDADHAQVRRVGGEQGRDPARVGAGVGQRGADQRHARCGGGQRLRVGVKVGHVRVRGDSHGETLAADHRARRHRRPVLVAVDVGLVADLKAGDAGARETSHGRVSPAGRAGRDSGDQVEVDDQVQAQAPHEPPRHARPSRREAERPLGQPPGSRRPEGVVGRVTSDPEHERARAWDVQEPQHSLKDP